MSLRARLVLVLGSLVALLLAAEWSLVRALTRDLDQEVDVVALTVGSSLLSLFVPEDGDPGTQARVDVRGAAWRLRGGDVPGALLGSELPPTDGLRIERAIVMPGEGPPLDLVRQVGRRASEGSLEGRRWIRAAHARGVEDTFKLEGDLEVIVMRSELPAPTELEQVERDHAPSAPQDGNVAPGDEGPRLEQEGVDTPRYRESQIALRVGSHTVAMPLDIEGLPWPATARVSATWSPHADMSVPADHIAASGPSTRWAPVSAPTTGHTSEHTGGPGTTSALRIPVPRGGLDRAVDTFLSKLLLGSIALFALGLGAIAWVAHRVTRPLRNLADAAERVGRGQLGTVVDEAGDRDVTKTLRAFNDMSLRLAALDEEAQRLRDREHLGELGDVARGLAHALRNPLHTLGLAVDALGTGRDDARETVRAARTQIQRIDGALEGFLTLAGAGGIREEVALDDLARDVALELAQSTQPCAVRVVADGGPVPIACVPAELRAVVHALVVNAAEAAPGEPVVVRVERTPDRLAQPMTALGVQDSLAQPLTALGLHVGARARLEVLDRGPGLAPDVRARLFTPHVTTKAHGTGMGLYLAERIARTRYGGSLALHERPGGGVRAVLELSLDGAGAPGVAVGSELDGGRA